MRVQQFASLRQRAPDGLTDLVDDWMIREIMTSGDSLEVIADNLVRSANANGGSDNITVIVVSVYDENRIMSHSGSSITVPPRY